MTPTDDRRPERGEVYRSAKVCFEIDRVTATTIWAWSHSDQHMFEYGIAEWPEVSQGLVQGFFIKGRDGRPQFVTVPRD